MHLKSIIGAGLFILALRAGVARSAPQVAVLQVGDSSSAASTNGTPVRINYFDPTLPNQSSPVSATLIPSTGANELVLTGAVTDGQLVSAPNGDLVFAGYHAAAGTSNVMNTSSLVAPRVIGTVHGSTYTLAASFGSDSVNGKDYGGSNIGSGATDGNGHFWGAGSTEGTILAGGGSNNVAVQSTLSNTRTVSVVNGNLYFSTLKNTRGIYSLGPAASATSAVTPTLVIATGTNSVPNDFEFSPDGLIAYVTDDRPNTGLPNDGAGVQRFDKIGGVWALSYTLKIDAAGDTPLLGLGVDWSGANPIVYASTDASSTSGGQPISSEVLRWVDSGAGAVPTVLATAPTGTEFLGVEFVPEPSSVGVWLTICSMARLIRRRRHRQN